MKMHYYCLFANYYLHGMAYRQYDSLFGAYDVTANARRVRVVAGKGVAKMMPEGIWLPRLP